MQSELKADVLMQPTQPERYCLISDDQAWLASYGVDPSWQNNPALVEQLNEVVAIGSLRLDEPINQTPQARSNIMAARERFYAFAEISDDTLAAFRAGSPTIIPLDTFIGCQRAMASLGLDAAKVINTLPSALNYAPESVQAKVDNLTALGLDAAKVINAQPATIGLAPESVQAKFDNLAALGLNAAKVINASPTTLSYTPESVRAKFDNLTALGLDAAKVINTLPSALNYAPESVQAKVDNLTALGLDAAKVINAQPATIGLAPESVRAKMKFIDRSIRVLKWEYSATELVESFPPVLGFNIQKLQVLRRIAAYHINKSSRSAEPKQVGSALIWPLEKYIITLSKQNNETSDAQHMVDLVKEMHKNKMPVEERKAVALIVAPDLGKTGTKYLRYRKQ